MAASVTICGRELSKEDAQKVLDIVNRLPNRPEPLDKAEIAPDMIIESRGVWWNLIIDKRETFPFDINWQDGKRTSFMFRTHVEKDDLYVFSPQDFLTLKELVYRYAYPETVPVPDKPWILTEWNGPPGSMPTRITLTQEESCPASRAYGLLWPDGNANFMSGADYIPYETPVYEFTNADYSVRLPLEYRNGKLAYVDFLFRGYAWQIREEDLIELDRIIRAYFPHANSEM